MSAAAPAARGPSPDWRAALKSAAYAFVLSRLLVLFAAAAAVAFAQQWPVAAQEDAGTTLRLFTAQDLDALAGRALGNDAAWYLSIARDGYEERPFDAATQANWAFFPLHPMAWRALLATGIPPVVAGVLMANLLFFFGLVQVHRWVQVQWDRGAADRAVLCLALFPTAYFFSLPWSESLFLVVFATALLAIAQRRWGLLASMALLASGTRAVGVLLAPLAWWAARQDPQARLHQRWLYPALGTGGLLAFMALLWSATGNPLAFSDIQAAWGRDGGSLTKHLVRWLADPLLLAEPWNLRWLNNTSLLLALAGTAWLWRQGQRALAVFVFVYVLIPWSTGTLMSMARYVVACVPVFAAMAAWLGRPPLLLAWLLASACLLAWMSAHFALGSSFAGA
ncbi:mannosyltransferase family protein [Arenimonas sp.]|uniref:mannosyltransferase family protein n=1 Tax=Arenimonas sp. TaxID=1872635 RepID=UPI0025D9CCE6|nr:mannosyltransferase family protein [Arenimonas sp.]